MRQPLSPRARQLAIVGGVLAAYWLAVLLSILDARTGRSEFFTWGIPYILTFPSSTTVGPLITLQDNVFNAVTTGNFTAALNAVNNAAIRSTYAQIKTLVTQYVINGVRHHDFTYKA